MPRAVKLSTGRQRASAMRLTDVVIRLPLSRLQRIMPVFARPSTPCFPPVPRQDSVRAKNQQFCTISSIARFAMTMVHVQLRPVLRKKFVCTWVAHYNQGRPHASLGAGLPALRLNPIRRPKVQRHELAAACRIRIKDVLSGLHHEYWLEETAA